MHPRPPGPNSLSDLKTAEVVPFDLPETPSVPAPPVERREEVSLSDRPTDGAAGVLSTASSDLRAAAEHLDDVEFEFVDLARHYEVQGELGQGGMGIVYRAIEKAMRRPVAIKRLQPELVANRRALARFQSEAIAVAALNHEHIVRIYRMGRDDTSPFLVLELVEGGSLAERLTRGTLAVDEAVRMFIGLASGLALSHRHGIIHRDIKPGNILLTLEGVAKLTDFGIARQEDGLVSTASNAVLGTLVYMPPEQLKSATAVTERSDLYSLAATLYQAVTGELPQSIRESRLPEPIRNLTMKALEFDPTQRHASVDEFAAELRTVQLQLASPLQAPVETADLQEGECPHCHTINPVTRKFCKTKGCGKPLYEPCPLCQASTPAWEAICAECGTDIPAHWEAAEQDLHEQAQQVESLSGEKRYAQALAVVEPIEALDLPRWQPWQEWASATANSLRADLAEQQHERDRLFAAAQAAFQSARYSEVVSLLDQIHADQVPAEATSLRSLASACLNELDELLKAIKVQVASKDYDGLRRNVDRVLTLSPGDRRVAKLDTDLRDREETIRAQREAERKQREAEQQQQAQEAARLKKERLEASRKSAMDNAQQPTPIRENERPAGGGGKPNSKPNWKHYSGVVGMLALPAYFALKFCFWLFSGTAVPPAVAPTGINNYPTVVAPVPPSEALGTKAGDTQQITLPGGVTLKQIWCPAGAFKMGTPGATGEEKPVDVTLTKGFWMGQTEVTQSQWTAVMGTGSKPWSGKTNVKVGPDFPATYISHGVNEDGTIEANSATAFCEKLTELERKAGRLPSGWKYSLPTEAQWEYACRAGTKTTYSFGDDDSQLGEYAWYTKNADDIGEKYAHTVGRKRPNPWGFFDLHGNVYEWCQDGYEAQLPGGRDPVNVAIKDRRVLRGGSWNSNAWYTRSAFRNRNTPDNRNNNIGFRVVRTE